MAKNSIFFYHNSYFWPKLSTKISNFWTKISAKRRNKFYPTSEYRMLHTSNKLKLCITIRWNSPNRARIIYCPNNRDEDWIKNHFKNRNIITQVDIDLVFLVRPKLVRISSTFSVLRPFSYLGPFLYFDPPTWTLLPLF